MSETFYVVGVTVDGWRQEYLMCKKSRMVNTPNILEAERFTYEDALYSCRHRTIDYTNPYIQFIVLGDKIRVGQGQEASSKGQG